MCSCYRSLHCRVALSRREKLLRKLDPLWSKRYQTLVFLFLSWLPHLVMPIARPCLRYRAIRALVENERRHFRVGFSICASLATMVPGNLVIDLWLGDGVSARFLCCQLSICLPSICLISGLVAEVRPSHDQRRLRTLALIHMSGNFFPRSPRLPIRASDCTILIWM